MLIDKETVRAQDYLESIYMRLNMNTFYCTLMKCHGGEKAEKDTWFKMQ